MREAIFGGPRPRNLEAMIRAAGIEFPCRIAVAKGVVRGGPAGARALALHPGMTYLMLPSEPRPWRGRKPLMGESYHCAEASQWLNRLRRGIISLRQAELKDASITPSREDEEQARLVALAQVQRNSSDWRNAVKVWSQMVMRQHHDHLNLVRRKMVVFIADLTAPWHCPRNRAR